MNERNVKRSERKMEEESRMFLELEEKEKGKQTADFLRCFVFGGLNVINKNSCCYIFITFILLVN